MKKLVNILNVKIANGRTDKMSEKVDKMRFKADTFIRNGEFEKAKELIQQADKMRKKLDLHYSY